MKYKTGSSVCTDSGDDNRREWNFATLHDLHVRANSVLRQAMLNERYKRWRKVVDLYNELLWLIDLAHFPEDYEPPSSYSMLLYELHYHLGVAYQHLGNHGNAVKEYSKTIEVVSISKNGCLAGCLTNSCLMTPIYTRRAFAHAKLGSYKLSLKDAEKAVVLDSQSPDVYCIRALVRSTFDDEILGLRDLETALRLDSDHVCAVMLKASFTKPLFADENKMSAYEKLRAKAVRLCQEAETYLTCNSFTHSCILEFYDKFLFPLSVPHTITRIDLRPEKPSRKQLESSVQSAKNNSPQENGGDELESKPEIFRCGTISNMVNNRMSLQRRTDYGNAIRKHMARPKTAKQFFDELEKQRRKDIQSRRAQSAIVRPGQRFARPLADSSAPDSREATRPPTGGPVQMRVLNSTPFFSDPCTRPFTAPARNRPPLESPVRPTPDKLAQGDFRETLDSSDCRQPRVKAQSADQHRVRPSARKTIVIETPANYSIPIFQSTNIKNAPRMYYRPWSGDKLPVSERPVIKFAPKFY
ncbi:uncharacterized protein LOC127860886 isoform X10 [Dreissena polymorpha]|uniref:uncharacterized protein LOC127860886 isoform X9 n=1 Tax=Dreissena polymorpha TaxID=45954 RepID=UPI002265373D|nr:uncharacterized protein LOC127860886 isoform X9 [Dreissena polymorpha]XP_052255218.1 uncharacterized protein LOC127860886 isoform X10 [Dreissena polymorpha]